MWKQIKLILKSVREYKPFALITPLFMVIEALMETCLPFVMSMFIETIQSNPSDFLEIYHYTNQNLAFLEMPRGLR